MDSVDREQNELQTVKLIESIEDYVTNQVPFDKSAIIKSVPGNHANVEKFMNLYDYYDEPRYDPAGYLSYFRACEREKHAVNQERKRNARRNNIPIEELDLFKDDSKEREKIVENKGRFLGMDPYTGINSIPIIWKKDVSMESFRKLVKFYGDSKNNKQLDEF